MRPRTLLMLLGVGAVMVGFTFLQIPTADVFAENQQLRKPSEVGRYQSAGGDQNEVWLVDTTTGECWRAHTLGENRRWEQLVPPLPVDPPKARPDKLGGDP